MTRDPSHVAQGIHRLDPRGASGEDDARGDRNDNQRRDWFQPPADLDLQLQIAYPRGC